ncbi:MAG: twin-arginine translocase TatA/TatE family subunit [Nitrospinota bacterium]|nr:twin-arginine translocase TatA/TatE family subunit [Nitrospinota bacterium]
MMGIGFPELMIILVIIMIIFGAGKLPEIGSAFGNSIKNFKKSMKEVNEVKEEMNVEAAITEDEGGEAKDSQQDEEAVSPTPETQENKT